MICWYCHWGWPKQVHDIYQHAAAQMDGDTSALDLGPAHIVWSDENFDDASIKWCMEHFGENADNDRFSGADLAVVMQSLVAILAVPSMIRCCVPDLYDGECPENFPPAAGLEMVKK